MAYQHKEATDQADQGTRLEGRSARSNLPYFHTGLWHFVVTQILGPAERLHRLRNLSGRMLDDAVTDTDAECCQ